MRVRRIGSWSASAAILPAAIPDPPPGWGGRPLIAYLLAGALAVVALYLLIRLLIWDRINQETPNQEEPLFRETEEPSREGR
jgi:hypothetical protein